MICVPGHTGRQGVRGGVGCMAVVVHAAGGARASERASLRRAGRCASRRRRLDSRESVDRRVKRA